MLIVEDPASQQRWGGALCSCKEEGRWRGGDAVTALTQVKGSVLAKQWGWPWGKVGLCFAGHGDSLWVTAENWG